MAADQDGMIVARRVAQWHIGDPNWADVIVFAYLNPTEAQAALETAMKEDQ